MALALVLAGILTGCTDAEERAAESVQPSLSTTAERLDPPPPTPPGADGDAAATVETTDPEPPASDPVGEDDAAPARIAQALGAHVPVFATPDAGQPVHDFTNPTPIGAPLVFLVVEERPDWLEVLIPIRPNGSTGWIRRDEVSLAETGYQVIVGLSDHQLTLRDRGAVIMETSIGVGGDGSPTPPGLYYITELLQPPDPTGPYGPFAFGLSGFSEVHQDFAGGEGVIGLHGTDDPTSIGRDASAGCIRLDNEVIRELAGLLPLGTPVVIIA